MDTLNARVTPADLKRVAIEQYRDGSGWFAHSPRNGGTGPVYATALHKSEVLAWAARLGLRTEVI